MMITEDKKIEFWNYLTSEKNILRPRGITVQRLALIKPKVLESVIWFDVIARHGAEKSSEAGVLSVGVGCRCSFPVKLLEFD